MSKVEQQILIKHSKKETEEEVETIVRERISEVRKHAERTFISVK